MAKDLIIGGASGYGWNELKYWVNSIKQSGFTGDIALVATNISMQDIEKLTSNGVIIHLYGEKQPDGSVRNPNQGAPHVERFIYIWNYLNSNKNKYRFVVVTDTRDVIFQEDPTNVLTKRLKGNRDILCASEELTYKDEPWNRQNMINTFGPLVYNELENHLICNVGTFAGYYEPVKDLVLELFMGSINRPIPIVDQAVFNFLINMFPRTNHVLISNNEGAWAAQLGATIGAIEAGAGDLGVSIKREPSKLKDYLDAYKGKQPQLEGDLVTNGTKPFTLVHQWDRVPAIKEVIERKYGGEGQGVIQQDNILVFNTGN